MIITAGKVGLPPRASIHPYIIFSFGICILASVGVGNDLGRIWCRSRWLRLLPTTAGNGSGSCEWRGAALLINNCEWRGATGAALLWLRLAPPQYFHYCYIARAGAGETWPNGPLVKAPNSDLVIGSLGSECLHIIFLPPLPSLFWCRPTYMLLLEVIRFTFRGCMVPLRLVLYSLGS
jgi:hypothetical protein